jgi:hypothetical protein
LSPSLEFAVFHLQQGVELREDGAYRRRRHGLAHKLLDR